MSYGKDFIVKYKNEDGKETLGLFSMLARGVCLDLAALALGLGRYDETTKNPIGWADELVARINTYVLEDVRLNQFMGIVKGIDDRTLFARPIRRALSRIENDIIKLTSEVKKSHEYVGLTSHVGLHSISTDILFVDTNQLLLLLREFVDIYSVNYCRGYDSEDLDQLKVIYKERRQFNRIRLFGRMALWVFKRRSPKIKNKRV